MSIDFDPASQFRDRLVWSYRSGIKTVTVGYYLGDVATAITLIDTYPSNYSHSVYFNQSLYYAKDGDGVYGGRSMQRVLAGLFGESSFIFHHFSIAHHLTQPGAFPRQHISSV